ILAIGVLAIPYDTLTSLGNKDFLDKEIVFCKNTTIDITSTQQNLNQIVKCGDESENKTTIREVMNPSNSQNLYGIMTLYTYGVMSLDTKTLLNSQDGLATKISDISIKIVIDVLFIMIYGVLLIALFMALFARGFYLWIFAMISPIFGLLYFFKKSGSGVGGGKIANLNIIQMIKLALMPVYVLGALSFGLLFLFVAGNTTDTNFGEIIDGNTLNYNGSSLEVLYIDKNELSESNIFNNFGGSIGKLLLQIFGLIIIWVSVIAALKSSKITETIVQPFEQIGNQISGLASKLPSYAPIIPTPDGMMSAQTLNRGINAFSQKVEAKLSEPGSQLGNKLASAFMKPNEDFDKILDLQRDAFTSSESVTNGINELISRIDKDRLGDRGYRENVGKAFAKIGMTDDAVKKLVDSSGSVDFQNILSQLHFKERD
ncbi:MAG: hypothetical protein NWP80_00860, partial [Candidatus Gracilibacteria bacterium]|nr:hypothetical protein [Candidatus Gracilibacteria bacterium]